MAGASSRRSSLLRGLTETKADPARNRETATLAVRDPPCERSGLCRASSLPPAPGTAAATPA
eukprot:6343418-Prymnesium_polylepis.1